MVDNLALQRREYWRDGILHSTITPDTCYPANPFGSFPQPYPTKVWDRPPRA